jgi:hypothetical protein
MDAYTAALRRLNRATDKEIDAACRRILRPVGEVYMLSPKHMRPIYRVKAGREVVA